VTINELVTPCLIFVTASLCSIPFNLSLNTPVIDDVVYSTDWIANSIAWTAWAFSVSSNPLNIVFIGAEPVSFLPSCVVSIH
jgi:hypothetical protein